jgi:hypothetical protein
MHRHWTRYICFHAQSLTEEQVAKAREEHAAVSVAEHGNSAVLVTVGPGGALLDRRRIDLTHGLPTHPYHHEGSGAVGRYVNSAWARPISLSDAVALVERVRESAARGARESLETLAAAMPMPIASIAIRARPELPATTEQRIIDTRAANVADSVVYREALASAAEARGWGARLSPRSSGARRQGCRCFPPCDGPSYRTALAGQTQACGACGESAKVTTAGRLRFGRGRGK